MNQTPTELRPEPTVAPCQTPAVPKKELLQYGGQAVIEGVMMRSPHFFAVACRHPDGHIVVQREEVDKTFLGPIARLPFVKWPFIRGTFALLDAMALGTRALSYASNIQLDVPPKTESNEQLGGQLEEPSFQQNDELAPAMASDPHHSAPAQKKSRINDIAIGGTIIFSLVFAVLLFKMLPTLIGPALQHIGLVSKSASDRQLNMLDGIFRFGIFFGYILLISQMKQIHRVFMYHGAEHKAINTLEAGLPLTLDNALKASRIHPRCGTSFIFIVLMIDLIVVTFLPRFPFFLARFALQVSIVPVVAGIAYEVIKFAGKFRRNPLVMAAFAPGMATQYLTTRQPDASQTQVALAALYSVFEAEGHSIPACDFYTPSQSIKLAEPEIVLT